VQNVQLRQTEQRFTFAFPDLAVPGISLCPSAAPDVISARIGWEAGPPLMAPLSIDVPG
jgi:hypothetical protein